MSSHVLSTTHAHSRCYDTNIRRRMFMPISKEILIARIMKNISDFLQKYCDSNTNIYLTKIREKKINKFFLYAKEKNCKFFGSS